MNRPIDVVLSRLEPFRVRPDGRNRWRACCPAHGGSNPSALSIGIGQDDAVLLTCWPGCDFATIVSALGLEPVDLWPSKAGAAAARPPLLQAASPQAVTAPQVKHETLSSFGRALWSSCVPIAGVAAKYLEARCCVIPPSDGDLRFHPALRHGPSGTIGPALVALVTDARTGQPISLHQSWIRADGSKAPLDPPRMLLAGHRKKGGAVRLWPDEAVTTGLGLTEGIETALSLAHAMAPTWACIDAGNLAAFPVLPGIEALTIAADHDPAGRKAAPACAERWAAAGVEVRVVLPPNAGTDLNDVAVEAYA